MNLEEKTAPQVAACETVNGLDSFDCTVSNPPCVDTNTEWQAAYSLACKAMQWIEDNPTAWQQIVDYVLADVRAKRYASMQRAIEETRFKWHVDNEGKRTKICNTLAPAFSRILIAQHPEAAKYLHTCKCRFDDAGMPWMVANE